MFQHIYVGEVLTNKDIRGIMMVPMWSAATSNDFPSQPGDPLSLLRCCVRLDCIRYKYIYARFSKILCTDLVLNLTEVDT